ncbi:MAG: cupin domain-containing protein [Pyrodictiaceae archaeon]
MEDFVEVMPGVRSRLLYCDENMVVVETILEKNARVPRHKHGSVQVSFCSQGRMELILGDGRRIVMGPGDYHVIPAGLEHEALAIEKTRVVDVNAPFTEDRRSLVEKLGGCPKKG